MGAESSKRSDGRYICRKAKIGDSKAITDDEKVQSSKFRVQGYRFAVELCCGQAGRFANVEPGTLNSSQMPTDFSFPDSAAKTAAQAGALAAVVPPEFETEKMSLSMGPSHPSTHGVLRVQLELDGEIVTKADPVVGYLHRGDEKIAENMTYNQFVPYTDRLDYLAPLANNMAYAIAVEKLAKLEVPARCQAIRVLTAELARVSSHLLGLGAFAIDVGAWS